MRSSDVGREDRRQPARGLGREQVGDGREARGGGVEVAELERVAVQRHERKMGFGPEKIAEIGHPFDRADRRSRERQLRELLLDGREVALEVAERIARGPAGDLLPAVGQVVGPGAVAGALPGSNARIESWGR